MMGRKGLASNLHHALNWSISSERWGWNTEDSRVDMSLIWLLYITIISRLQPLSSSRTLQ